MSAAAREGDSRKHNIEDGDTQKTKRARTEEELPAFTRESVAISTLLDKASLYGANDANKFVAKLLPIRTKCAALIASLDVKQVHDYSWGEDPLHLWDLIKSVWEVMGSSSAPQIICKFFPVPFFWCATRKQLYQQLFWPVFLMELNHTRRDINIAGLMTNRISKVVFGSKNLGKTVLCGAFAAICAVLFPHVIPAFFDYASVLADIWLPSQLLERAYTEKTGRTTSFANLVASGEYSCVFISDEIQDIYVDPSSARYYVGTRVIGELAEIGNQKDALSVIAGSVSDIPQRVYRSHDEDRKFEGYRDLNHTKHTKYQLLPISERDEARELLHLRAETRQSSLPITEELLESTQWMCGGMIDACLAEDGALPVSVLPAFSDPKAVVLTQLSQAIVHRTNVDPFSLPTISRAALQAIITEFKVYHKQIDIWCDSGFLFEKAPGVFALQRPDLLRKCWEAPSGLTLEQLVALTPLTTQSLGRVAEAMLLEDIAMREKWSYSSRSLSTAASSANNVVDVRDLDSAQLCSEVWHPSADYCGDGLKLELREGKVCGRAIFQVNFWNKGLRFEPLAIRNRLRSGLLRWRELFSDKSWDIEWSPMEFHVYFFGTTPTSQQIAALTAPLEVKKVNHTVVFHGAIEVLNILRPSARRHILNNKYFYHFLNE